MSDRSEAATCVTRASSTRLAARTCCAFSSVQMPPCFLCLSRSGSIISTTHSRREPLTHHTAPILSHNCALFHHAHQERFDWSCQEKNTSDSAHSFGVLHSLMSVSPIGGDSTALSGKLLPRLTETRACGSDPPRWKNAIARPVQTVQHLGYGHIKDWSKE
jgi:hypothetical protein